MPFYDILLMEKTSLTSNIFYIYVYTYLPAMLIRILVGAEFGQALLPISYLQYLQCRGCSMIAGLMSAQDYIRNLSAVMYPRGLE